MSGNGGNFGGGGASGSWIPDPDQSAAETARLLRQRVSVDTNQSPAETARLNRQQSSNNAVPGISHNTDNIVTSSEVEDFDKIALNFQFQQIGRAHV